MNTLVCSQKSPLHLVKPSPWKPMAPAMRSTNMEKLNNPSATWKLKANAKGFGSTPTTIEESRNGRSFKQDSSNQDDEIPEGLFNRIIVRILVSVGAPMALGIAQLNLFGMLREQHIWEAPMWVLFVTSFVTFGASALGIPYGALSTSLDPDKKGSFLGFEEAQHNWVEMWKEDEKSK